MKAKSCSAYLRYILKYTYCEKKLVVVGNWKMNTTVEEGVVGKDIDQDKISDNINVIVITIYTFTFNSKCTKKVLKLK